MSMLTSSIPLVLASLQACMTEYGRTAPKPLLLKKKGVTYEGKGNREGKGKDIVQ